MTIRLRQAVAEDAPLIAELFRTSFVDTFGNLYPPTDLEEFLTQKSTATIAAEIDDPDTLFQLATVNNLGAGFIKLGPPQLPIETPPDSMELCQLYVGKEWHGTGVAATLMDFALDEAKSRGAHFIQLSVFIDNHRARRFYERYAFTAVGQYDFRVGSHIDQDIILRHVVMQASR